MFRCLQPFLRCCTSPFRPLQQKQCLSARAILRRLSIASSRSVTPLPYRQVALLHLRRSLHASHKIGPTTPSSFALLIVRCTIGAACSFSWASFKMTTLSIRPMPRVARKSICFGLAFDADLAWLLKLVYRLLGAGAGDEAVHRLGEVLDLPSMRLCV